MGRTILKYLGRLLLVLFTTIAWVALILVISIHMFVNGPSKEARNLFVTTLLETGKLKFVVGMFVPDDVVQGIVNQNSMVAMEQDTDETLIEVADPVEVEKTEPITVEHIEGDNFTAVLMTVADPSRVFVGTSSPWTEYGKELDKLVNDYGATAGINGGLYNSDANKGGRPIGPVVSEGQIQNMNGLGYTGIILIGMSEDNILKIIDISGKSQKQVEQLIADEKIRDAICFQEEASDSNNHFVKLVINGEKRELNGLGSGANPRTAIGQTKDGKILMLVTDGRGANGHLGATAADLIDIMYDHGAVNAANLDGGSSTTMYYNGEYLRTSVTFYYSNSSWRIPTSVLVR